MSESNGDVKAAIEAMESLIEAEYLDESELVGTGVAILPKGKVIHDLRGLQDARLTAPRRLEGRATHTTLDSFIEHVNRFKDSRSAIFASDEPGAPALLAVYDYHRGPSDPRFGKHRAAYAFPLSDAWKAWQALAARGWVSQADLAAFLEERIADVLVPEDALYTTREKTKKAGLELGGPSAISGLARHLNVTVSAEISSATTLATGEGQLLYKESHTTSVKVPSGFLLSIPVFRGGLAEDVIVRLRYRPDGGKVRFAVLLHDVDALFRNAFDEACQRVSEKTAIGEGETAKKLSLFYGSPE